MHVPRLPRLFGQRCSLLCCCELLHSLLCVISNVADVEVSMQRITEDEVHWKSQVIIACTVTVAVEMVMITMMVMCWRQLRWTLMKLACSCVRFFSYNVYCCVHSDTIIW